jgi:DNA-binding PadR family transcriptional regulator
MLAAMSPGTRAKSPGSESPSDDDKLMLEVRRGVLTLAVLGELRRAGYGYSLLQRLADRGLDIEQGTLYPLLRRLDEQGLLESDWNVEGTRPRKYYRLSLRGSWVLERLTAQWNDLVEVVGGLLDDRRDDEEGHRRRDSPGREPG